LIGPVGDRGQSVVADQRLDVALGDLGQALLRDVGDDPMPLPPPAIEGDCWDKDRCQHRCRRPFHRVLGWADVQTRCFADVYISTTTHPEEN